MNYINMSLDEMNLLQSIKNIKNVKLLYEECRVGYFDDYYAIFKADGIVDTNSFDKFIEFNFGKSDFIRKKDNDYYFSIDLT